ncbi:hypothetical protein TrRE_jg5886, partial [Triparma retinervis]
SPTSFASSAVSSSGGLSTGQATQKIVTLYTLEVYEDDFHLLKASQSLLVDFGEFPTMLQSVLAQCSSRSYTARLEEGQGGSCRLSVVEPSRFKELTHLSLAVRKCNDREIRPYLAARVNELTEELRGTLGRVKEGEREVKEGGELVGKLREDIAKERLERESLVRTIRLEMGEKGREAEIDNQRKARDMVEQARREFQEREEEMRRDNKDMQEKIERIKEEREKAIKDKFELEGSVRSLTIDLESRTKLVEKLTSSNALLQTSITEKDSAIFSLERENHKLQLTMAAMEQSMGQEEERERKMSSQRKEWTEAKESLLAQNSLLSGAVESLEGKVGRASKEIEKGNSIISRLQTDHRQAKSRLKVLTSSLRNAEVSAAARSDEIAALTRKYSAISIEKKEEVSRMVKEDPDAVTAACMLIRSSLKSGAKQRMKQTAFVMECGLSEAVSDVLRIHQEEVVTGKVMDECQAMIEGLGNQFERTLRLVDGD